MYNNNKMGVIIVAAGQGRRMASNVSKQFIEVDNKPILAYTVEKFQNHEWIDEIVLVVGSEEIEFANSSIKEQYNFTKINKIISGGYERQDSVFKGIEALSDDIDYVLIHDGVRPFVEESSISSIIEEVCVYKACILGVKVKDTIKMADYEGFINKTPNRDLMFAAQTPQAFDKKLIYKAYLEGIKEKSYVTDDAMMVEKYTDVRIKITNGSYGNIKITTIEDMSAFN